jgi:hypothetical protein
MGEGRRAGKHGFRRRSLGTGVRLDLLAGERAAGADIAPSIDPCLPLSAATPRTAKARKMAASPASMVVASSTARSASHVGLAPDVLQAMETFESIDPADWR